MGMGMGPDWNKIFSTEHNIDYFSLLQMLHEIYAESSADVRSIFQQKHIEDVWIQDEMKHVGDWIREIAFTRKHYACPRRLQRVRTGSPRILDGTSWASVGSGRRTTRVGALTWTG